MFDWVTETLKNKPKHCHGFLTFHTNLKDQLFISNFTGIFSSILLLHVLHQQLTALALWLHVDSLTGAQLLTILEPFHLSLDVRHFTAQCGFLGSSYFDFLLIRVLVGEGGLNVWCRSKDLGIQYQKLHLVLCKYWFSHGCLSHWNLKKAKTLACCSYLPPES